MSKSIKEQHSSFQKQLSRAVNSSRRNILFSKRFGVERMARNHQYYLINQGSLFCITLIINFNLEISSHGKRCKYIRILTKVGSSKEPLNAWRGRDLTFDRHSKNLRKAQQESQQRTKGSAYCTKVKSLHAAYFICSQKMKLQLTFN